MTKRVINWEVLDAALKENELYSKKLEEYETAQKEKEELELKLDKLENVTKPPVPKIFEDLGILSVIPLTGSFRDYDSYFELDSREGVIVGVTNDTIKVIFGVGYHAKKVDIPMKDIKENGYFIVDDEWFICDKLDLDKRKVLLDLIFKRSKGVLEKQIEGLNEQLERAKNNLDEANKKLAKYNNIPESWVRRVLNKLDFSISLGRTCEESKQEIDNTINNLPRVYKI